MPNARCHDKLRTAKNMRTPPVDLPAPLRRWWSDLHALNPGMPEALDDLLVSALAEIHLANIAWATHRAELERLPESARDEEWRRGMAARVPPAWLKALRASGEHRAAAVRLLDELHGQLRAVRR